MAAMITAVVVAGATVVAVFVSMNALLYFRRANTTEPGSEGDVGRILTAKKAPVVSGFLSADRRTRLGAPSSLLHGH